MKEIYLKNYKMKIKTEAPVFIGDGSKIGKKEFIYMERKNKVGILNMPAFFHYLEENRLEVPYMDYVLEAGNKDLGRWLNENKISGSEYGKFLKYTLDAGDALIDVRGNNSSRDYRGKRSAKAKEIFCFVKDAEGMPYVPGSSIKGMIRTALLAWEIGQNDDIRKEHAENISREISRSMDKRKYFLNKQTSELETEVFHTIERKDIKKSIEIPKQNAVCSNMSGLLVSDSAPINTSCLTLCQKIDLSVDGKEKPLPLLREALRPGSDIFFDITIDPGVFPYEIEDILEALDYYQKILYSNFYSFFDRGSSKKGTVWLGGGCGFPAKTVIESLYPEKKKEAKITSDIFRKTLGKNYEIHKHSDDVIKYEISPHVCKCTKYKGQIYDMGRCTISILE